jgi:hypothetical protein
MNNDVGATVSSASAVDLPFAPNLATWSSTARPRCRTRTRDREQLSYLYAGPVRTLFPFRIRGRGDIAAWDCGCDGLDFAKVLYVQEMMSAPEAAVAGTRCVRRETLPLASAAGAMLSPRLVQGGEAW